MVPFVTSVARHITNGNIPYIPISPGSKSLETCSLQWAHTSEAAAMSCARVMRSIVHC